MSKYPSSFTNSISSYSANISFTHLQCASHPITHVPGRCAFDSSNPINAVILSKLFNQQVFAFQQEYRVVLNNCMTYKFVIYVSEMTITFKIRCKDTLFYQIMQIKNTLFLLLAHFYKEISRFYFSSSTERA